MPGRDHNKSVYDGETGGAQIMPPPKNTKLTITPDA
jgi:hypothetical protein